VEEVKKISKLVSDSDNNNNIVEIAEKIMYAFFTILGPFFKPEIVKGTLGDLLGLHSFILVVLTILVFSILLLFISYVVNIGILLGVIYKKEKIIAKFNYKIVKFYIEYQTFIIKFSLVYIPIFILAGFLILIKGLHFLITHQIPFEFLGLDINTYIDTSTLIEGGQNNTVNINNTEK
jgi:hypothetical protein